MKKNLMIVMGLFVSTLSFAQQERERIERTCLNYLEGFYDADEGKLKRALKPSLYKIGYWKSKGSLVFDKSGRMTYKQALGYARGNLREKQFADPKSVKEVWVLDIGTTTAVAKVRAYWGYDYLLLSKQPTGWMIESVLWEGN